LQTVTTAQPNGGGPEVSVAVPVNEGVGDGLPDADRVAVLVGVGEIVRVALEVDDVVKPQIGTHGTSGLIAMANGAPPTAITGPSVFGPTLITFTTLFESLVR